MQLLGLMFASDPINYCIQFLCNLNNGYIFPKIQSNFDISYNNQTLLTPMLKSDLIFVNCNQSNWIQYDVHLPEIESDFTLATIIKCYSSRCQSWT